MLTPWPSCVKEGTVQALLLMQKAESVRKDLIPGPPWEPFVQATSISLPSPG